MNKRIGVFGGTFNPIHAGHIAIAESAARAFALDQVLVIPAHVSPFRTQEADPAPDSVRMEMVRLACEGHSVLTPSDIEIRRGGVSYAIDTVKTIRAEHPGSDIFFIMGMDAFSGLGRWHEASELFTLCSFIVLARPGSPRVPSPDGVRANYLEGEPRDVSSTEIRRRIAAGESVERLLDPSVLRFIQKNLLYSPSN